MKTDHKWVETAAGIKMPGIIYGTAWKKDRTADLVVEAVKAGFRGVDTAAQPKHYSEALVGEALQRLKSEGIDRSDLFLQTKFTPLSGQDLSRVPYDINAAEELQVAQSFESSKRNLQTDYVDSLILHSPVAPNESMMKIWRAMERLHQVGSVLQLGISNCYSLELMQALFDDCVVKPAVLQNRFYRDTAYDKALRHWCSEHHVIYQSFWTLTANPHILSSHTVRALCGKYKKTEAQIFFRYLTHIGIVPLTGTTSKRHMKKDLDVFEYELSTDDIEDIGRLLN